MLVNKLLHNVIEDVIDMLVRGFVARDDVLLLIKPIWWVDCTFLRQGVPGHLGNSLLPSSPPSQLSHVSENNAWRIFIPSFERLNVFNEVNNRSLIDTPLAADYTMRKDSQILVGLVEEDNNTLLSGKAGGNEDREIRLAFLRVQGNAYLREAKGDEAIRDDFSDDLLDMSA